MDIAFHIPLPEISPVWAIVFGVMYCFVGLFVGFIQYVFSCLGDGSDRFTWPILMGVFWPIFIALIGVSIILTGFERLFRR